MITGTEKERGIFTLAKINKQLKIKTMNKENRKELEKAAALIEDAREIVERIKDDEQEKFDNLSEGLQQSEKGQKFEETVSALDEVFYHLEEAVDGISTSSE